MQNDICLQPIFLKEIYVMDTLLRLLRALCNLSLLWHELWDGLFIW